MYTSSDTIRILDLLHPVLTSRQRDAVEEAERVPVQLNADAILSAAKRMVGLDDLGSTSFQHRLDQSLQKAFEDANRTNLGHAFVFDRCSMVASLRLLLHDLLQRNPDIDNVEIENPIFIVGPPRSGSTHLHGILATHPEVRGFYATDLEELFPVLGKQSKRETLENFPPLKQLAQLLPYSQAMLPRDQATPIEHGILHCVDFSSNFLEWMSPVFRDYSAGNIESIDYSYLKTFLKALQWRYGACRWLLRWDDHSEHLKALLSEFPDATFVVTHRDPLAVIQSFVTMKAYVARLFCKDLRREPVVSFWSHRIESKIRAVMKDRDTIPRENLVDVYFHDFTGNEIAIAEDIFAKTGLTLDGQVRQNMRSFLNNNRRGRNGRIVYNWRQDFDSDPDDFREQFSFYETSYNIEREVE